MWGLFETKGMGREERMKEWKRERKEKRQEKPCQPFQRNSRKAVECAGNPTAMEVRQEDPAAHWAPNRADSKPVRDPPWQSEILRGI